MFAIACAAVLLPGLVDGKVAGFRDGLHFYFPQAVWLDQCAERGDYFPLWQADEGLGVNVPGETTSAIYYPLRVVMLLPRVSVAQRMAMFVGVHLAIAAAGMAYACSRWRLRKEAGWLSGVAFALSCPVFFQQHNLVFMCSAAWLGFILGEFGCWLRAGDDGGEKPRLVVLACALAMIVLAGDPHTAVNVVVLGGVVGLGKLVVERKLSAFAKSMSWFAAAVLLAIGLSAIQWVPTVQWALQSHRMLGESPQVAEQVVAPEIPAMIQEVLNVPAVRPANAIYEFSLSPWHALTTVWPTLGGDFSNGNARVFANLPSEGRMWVPSLFFGIVPLLLLFRRNRAAKRNQRWLMLAACVALLASFGNYSLGWLLRELLEAGGAKALAARFPADHVTSVYGVLADYLPGYALFRYPAKWSVIAVACFVLAAAVRFDQLDTNELLRGTRVRRVVAWCSGLALMAAGGLMLVLWFGGPNSASMAESLRNVFATPRTDAWLGPPMLGAMWRSVLFAFAVPLVVVAVLVGFRIRAEHVASRAGGRLFVHSLFAWLCLLEMFVVAMNWTAFVEVKNVKPSGPFTAEVVWANPREANIVADQWLSDADANPLESIAEYQRAFVLGKFGLLEHQRNVVAQLSIEPERLKRLRSGLSRLDNLTERQPSLDVALAWLGVEQRLVRERDAQGRATFHWHRILCTKALCEFKSADENADEAVVSWQWMRAGKLAMTVDCEANGRLLVRQFNDDGWQIDRAGEANGAGELQVERDASGLFVAIELPPGRHELMLVRKSWPLRVGLAISFVSALVCGGLVYINRASHRRRDLDQSN